MALYSFPPRPTPEQREAAHARLLPVLRAAYEHTVVRALAGRIVALGALRTEIVVVSVSLADPELGSIAADSPVPYTIRTEPFERFLAGFTEESKPDLQATFDYAAEIGGFAMAAWSRSGTVRFEALPAPGAEPHTAKTLLTAATAAAFENVEVLRLLKGVDFETEALILSIDADALGFVLERGQVPYVPKRVRTANDPTEPSWPGTEKLKPTLDAIRSVRADGRLVAVAALTGDGTFVLSGVRPKIDGLLNPIEGGLDNN